MPKKLLLLLILVIIPMVFATADDLDRLDDRYLVEVSTLLGFNWHPLDGISNLSSNSGGAGDITAILTWNTFNGGTPLIQGRLFGLGILSLGFGWEFPLTSPERPYQFTVAPIAGVSVYNDEFSPECFTLDAELYAQFHWRNLFLRMGGGLAWAPGQEAFGDQNPVDAVLTAAVGMRFPGHGRIWRSQDRFVRRDGDVQDWENRIKTEWAFLAGIGWQPLEKENILPATTLGSGTVVMTLNRYRRSTPLVQFHYRGMGDVGVGFGWEFPLSHGDVPYQFSLAAILGLSLYLDEDAGISAPTAGPEIHGQFQWKNLFIRVGAGYRNVPLPGYWWDADTMDVAVMTAVGLRFPAHGRY